MKRILKHKDPMRALAQGLVDIGQALLVTLDAADQSTVKGNVQPRENPAEPAADAPDPIEHPAEPDLAESVTNETALLEGDGATVSITAEQLESAAGPQLSEWIVASGHKVPRKLDARVALLRKVLDIAPLGPEALTAAPDLDDPIKAVLVDIVADGVAPEVEDLFGGSPKTREELVNELSQQVSAGSITREAAMLQVDAFDSAHVAGTGARA